jgi:hypothetical protein
MLAGDMAALDYYFELRLIPDDSHLAVDPDRDRIRLPV